MGARFSDCRRYRYELWREAQGQLFTGRGTLNFIMLNPSTADEKVNDPTVERCERRCRRWGYDRLVVTNLFAWRATDPSEIRKCDADPIGDDNDRTLQNVAKRANLVICAWGNDGGYRGRAKEVLQMLRDSGVQPHMLRVSKEGQPEHPLYLPYELEPQQLAP